MKSHPLPIVTPARRPVPRTTRPATLVLQVLACIALGAAGVAACIALIELTPNL